MADRQEIARRHSIAHLADKLVGDTPEQVEADAAAKAALIQMLTPRRLDAQSPEPVESPVEGLPPKDKPLAGEAEAGRTDDQRLGGRISEGLQPGAKRVRNAALLRSLRMLGDGDEQ